MKYIKVLLALIIIIPPALLFCALPAFAKDQAMLPESEWDDFSSAVPEEVKDKLPSGSLDSQEELFEGISEMSRGDYIIGVVLDIAGIELGNAAKLFFGLCGLILLCAVFSNFCDGLQNSSLSMAIRFCSAGAIASVIVYAQYEHFSLIEELFEKLFGVVSGVIPVVASIWAMGGNVSTASVGSASFGVILGVSQGIFATTLIPVSCILTVFGFCDSLSDEMRTARLVGTIKKIYVFLLGTVMTVLLASLAAQTSLASSADSAAARTARIVSGSAIPILGGSVGETFKSVGVGVSYLKNVFGIGSIIMIALLVLPIIISLLLTRFALMLGGGLADILSCPNEAKMLESLSETYGFMLAVVSGVAVMFILGLYIFMQTVVAVM